VSADLPIIQFGERRGILDLGCGHPNPSLLPVEPWLAATSATSASFGWQALTYGAVAGPGPLIEWLAARLLVDATNFFITAGASHALELISGLLCGPGDVVLVDAPTYHFALRVLRDRKAELVAAPSDEDGLDPAALEALLARLRGEGRRVPMLYLVPTFGNPTGRSLPGERRHELVRLAQRTGLRVVEDDTYRELSYSGHAPPSLWESDRGEAVLRIGSFSKTVAPGLRLGWINAPAGFVRTLSDLGYVDSGGGVNHANALAMATFGASGAYNRHVAEVRRAYHSRRDTLVAALRAALPGFAVPSPAGGWFVWLPLPPEATAREFLPVAERHGVSFVPGPVFYPDGVSGAGYVRLAFSFLEPAQLTEAAGRLAAAWAENSATSHSR
jgi:2-aminoadipate transaminase